MLLDPARSTFQVQPELADMQQRLRVGLDALHRDLLVAGAGLDGGPAAGPLHRHLAPILPFRVGTRDSDLRRGVPYRPDVLTVIYVPATAAQCRLRESIRHPQAPIALEPVPGCPVGDPLCGFAKDKQLVLFDEAGRWDLCRVTGTDAAAGQLWHEDDPLTNPYSARAFVAEAVARTYFLRRATERSHLVRYDGYKTEAEVVDRVGDFRVEYFGEPDPPELMVPWDEERAPRTSYGPAPPPMGVDDPLDGWPAGENCVFSRTADTGELRSRLARLPADAGSLSRLSAHVLIDGPWCPDGSATNRFDADLLRIRRVRLTLRVSAGALFAPPGKATGGVRFLTDREIQLDVSPRNLNFGR